MSTKKPQTPYFSNGQVLSSPPFSVRVSRFLESVYVFFGLYLVSFFSLDPYLAAQNSSFNIHQPKTRNGSRGPTGGGSGSYGSGGGGGGGGGGPGGPGKRIGRVDDVRGPDFEPSMSTVPLNDPDWAVLIGHLKECIPSRSLPELQIPSNIPRLIDHTLLALSASEEQIDVLCSEAKEYDFATVCVRPNYVARAAANLKGTNTGVASVVGFPEGTQDTKLKVQEAINAIFDGATELDMVINYPKLKDGGYTAVYNDIMAVRNAAPPPTKLKAILETSQLSRDELIAAAIVACTAGVDFIKTSTGFCGAGANVQDVRLMHLVAELCSNGCLVKASGGIRSADDCLRMLKAGAMRIGASSGVKIMQQVNEGESLEQGASHEAY
ncbi:hypothetical protein N7490_011733 [Penicillium lividum]|nr:hypothetical protein N7490_011733 [Penicillium lividum]